MQRWAGMPCERSNQLDFTVVKLGSGGFGDVKKAFLSGQAMAVKQLRVSQCASQPALLVGDGQLGAGAMQPEV